MSKKEERYIVVGLILAALGCIAAWLAVPQIQTLFNELTATSEPSKLELDGVWKGGTSDGGEIYFQVTGDQIIELSSFFILKKRFDSSNCPPSGSFGARQAVIDANRFSQVVDTTFVRIEIKGTFDSDNIARGTISPSSERFDNKECDAIEATWTATKQK